MELGEGGEHGSIHVGMRTRGAPIDTRPQRVFPAKPVKVVLLHTAT